MSTSLMEEGLSVPALQPYRALFFFAADDTDEVNREYAQAYDDGGFLRADVLAQLVTVVACEQGHGREAGMTFVYFLRDGRLERRDSWQVRAHR